SAGRSGHRPRFPPAQRSRGRTAVRAWHDRQWPAGLRLPSGVLVLEPRVVEPRVVEQRPAHLVEVGGDDDVQAGPGRTLLADGDQRDALPGPLRAELIAGELGGEFAQHRGVADHSHQLKYESVL